MHITHIILECYFKLAITGAAYATALFLFAWFVGDDVASSSIKFSHAFF